MPTMAIPDVEILAVRSTLVHVIFLMNSFGIWRRRHHHHHQVDF